MGIATEQSSDRGEVMAMRKLPHLRQEFAEIRFEPGVMFRQFIG